MTAEMLPVYLTLKEEIVTFALLPGARLREEALSARFGCSRTPMRDVLKKLEEDRLVRIRPKAGTYVTKIDVGGLKDLMYLRASLERSVMEELMAIVTEEELSSFRALLGEQEAFLSMERLGDREFAAAFFAFDNAFHEAIYRASGKEGTLSLLDASFPHFERYRYLTNLREKEDVSKLYFLHRELLDALEKKDGERLKKASLDHQFSGLSGLEAVKAKHPDYFLD